MNASGSKAPKAALFLDSVLYHNDVSVLSSYLKSQGINAKIFFKEIEGRDLKERISGFDPDYIMIPSEFRAHGGVGELMKNCSYAGELKGSTKSKIILFGRQATIGGENILKKFNWIDYVILGDPEYPARDIMLKGGQFAEGVIYRDENDAIVRKEVGIQTDLKSLPMPDYNEFFRHKDAAGMGFFVAISRGCVYNCAFCQNSHYSAITKTKSVSPRFYPAEWVIEGLEYLKNKYGPIRNLYFTDTSFTYSKKYLKEFLGLYRQKINIPFIAATRANLVDEEVAALLKEAGCVKVNFGTECGDETVRNKLLKKGLLDKDIIKCVDLLRSKNIRVQTGIIVALPDDTFESAFDSLAKAAAFKTDVLNVSIFQPYIGTELTDYAVRTGMLSGDFTEWKQSQTKQHGVSPLSLGDIKKIQNMQLLSPMITKMPNRKLFSILCSLPKNRVYFTVYHMSRIMRSIRYEIDDTSVFNKMRYFVYNLGRVFVMGKRPLNR